MKLRWLIKQNHVTSSEVVEYRNQSETSLQESKRVLVDQVGPILQYWREFDRFGNGTWEDVPTVIEYRS